MKKLMVAIVLGAVLIVGSLLVLNGRTDNSGSETESTSEVSENIPNLVEIEDFKYIPENLTVKKGAVVTWRNNDTTRHNIVFDDESLGEVDNGKLLSKGETATYTFDIVGEFSYFCQPHPFMKAKITVTE